MFNLVLVVWNSTIISEHPDIADPRILIYHDEINIRTGGTHTTDDNGALVCRHSGNPGDVVWQRPGSSVSIPANNDGDFRVIRQTTQAYSRLQLARVVQSPLARGNEGLWSCNGGDLPRRYMSLYRRGNGGITNVDVYLQSSSFVREEFTLIAVTTGGPPTNYYWTRNNGRSLITGVPIEADPDDNQNDRENCLYRSTLQITGSFPGVYEYHASNRAMLSTMRGSFTIEGGSPSNLQVIQTGMDTIQLSWNAPPGPPSSGYQVIDSRNSINLTTLSTSSTINMLSRGVYNFTVAALSQHFPGGIVGPQIITVRGALAPLLSLSQLTATSVHVSWTQPMLSFTVQSYGVALRRLTPCDSVTGIRGPRNQNANDMSELFEGLEEFITYRAEVTANFQSPSSFLTVSPVTAEMTLTTISIAPSAIPSSVVPTATSRIISVSWDFDCLNHNGPNFRYDVDLQRIDGGAVPAGTVRDNVFIVGGLQPFVNYTFRVRGVNDAGNGNYTQPIAIQTDEDRPGAVASLETQLLDFTSVLVSWSPPQEPNGIIIMYEIIYHLNESFPVSENVTNGLNSTIFAEVNSAITGLRVRAYTSVGPGDFAMAAPVMLFPSIVMNVQVESLTDTSVIVTWDRITDIPGITEYIVYYAPVSSSRKRQDNKQSVTVPSTENSVVISGLESAMEYQYQVTAVAMFDGERLEGERSNSTQFKIDVQKKTNVIVVVSISVVVSVLLTIILYSALLLVRCSIAHAYCYKRSKEITEGISGVAIKMNDVYDQPEDVIYAQPGESDYVTVKGL